MEPEQDIELRKYLEVLIHWWWVLLIVPAITAGIAYYYSTNQTPMYRATAEVLVQQARSGLILPGNPGTNEGLARTYARLANTRDLKNQLLEQLALDRLPDVEASGKGPIILISGENPDPVLARDVANKLAELLILDIQSSQLLQIARLETLAQSQGIGVSREILQAQLSTIDSLRVIEKALIPEAPFSPRTMLNTLLAGIIGLMLGGLIVFLLEYFNKSIRSPEELEELFGTTNPAPSALGVIFRWKPKVARSGLPVALDAPSSIYAEMFRQLRTSLQFVRAVHDTKAFLITSAAPREGKSTIVSNLAVVLAQGGSRVILVDGDLRRPSMHSVFKLPGPDSENSYEGLSSLLTDHSRPACEELVDVGVPGLKVMTSGRIPPNPADLLAADRTKAVFEELKEQCDILLVDSVPVMAAADPVILASYVDGVILTVAMGESRADGFRDAVVQIQRSGTPVIGYVLNKFKSRRLGYSHYHYNYYPQLEDLKAVHKKGAKLNAKGTPSLLQALEEAKNRMGRKTTEDG